MAYKPKHKRVMPTPLICNQLIKEYLASGIYLPTVPWTGTTIRPTGTIS